MGTWQQKSKIRKFLLPRSKYFYMGFGYYQAKRLFFECKIFMKPATGVSVNGKFI